MTPTSSWGDRPGRQFSLLWGDRPGRQSPMWGDRPGRQLPPAPRAFTLVELLVVIGIIGLLAAIITPVVMQSLTKARNAAIKAEIDMLHMAIMNYKNEYGSFPPCSSGVITASGTDAASKHLSRIFPRIPSTTAAAIQSQSLSYLNTAASPISQVQPESAIVLWLYGYNDDPTAPVYSVVAGAPRSRNKLFDFDTSRISSADYSYAPTGKPLSGFVYIDNRSYGAIGVGATIPTRVLSSGTYFGLRRSTSAAPMVFDNPTQPPFNPDSFQILCAGRDEQFGTDDDLSNFWPGTRREYLDSLKDGP